MASKQVSYDEKTSSAGQSMHETPANSLLGSSAEKRLLRKLDFTIIPLFTLVYCTNFIDRTAIGNAKIAGLVTDLDLLGFDYNIALTVFYLFYIAMDVPSNLALKHFGSIWLACMVTLFGIVAIGTAFVHTYGQLIVTRVFLGMAEGGTLSGLSYIMSRYYRRSEFVLRIGIFFGAAPALAGAFGGLLASGLLSVNDIGTVKSWRKIFLIEGIITTCFGIILMFILPGDPQTSRFLTEEQRELALARIDADQVNRTGGKRERTSLKLIGRSFSFITIFCAAGYVMINISFQGLSLFMPTVIATLGDFTTVESQLRTVPPYVVGIVYAVFIAYWSYKAKQRALPLFVSTCLIALGYILAVATKNPHARYAACFVSISGGSSAGPLFLAWGTDNAAPDTVRAVTTALIPGIGALGSIIAVWSYLPTDAPNYHIGNSLNLGTSSFSCVIVIILTLYIRHENMKRERGERDYRTEGKTEEELLKLGHLHPDYRYQG